MKLSIIGGITLDNEMWIDEVNNSSGVTAEVVENLDGGVIVFEQYKRTSKQNVTAKSSDSSGWQSKITLDALLALANGSIGQTISVTDSDTNTFDVRFRHEQSGGAVQFNRLVDAKLTDWYIGTIYLAKV